MGGGEEEDEKGEEEEGGVWRACGDVELVDFEDDEDVDVSMILMMMSLMTVKNPFCLGEKVES